MDLTALTPLQNAGLGVAAGTIEVIILQPMLYCKNAVQQSLPLTINPLVLYRGVSVSVINMSILTGVQFPMAGAIGKLMTGGVERPLNDTEKIGAGLASGGLSGFVCGPMELIMIQQQRFGSSLMIAIQRIVSEFGLLGLGLFRGLSVSCGREGAFTAGYLGLGPVFAQILKDRSVMDSKVADFVGAAASGTIAASLSHPLDTIKTCMQGDIERKVYTDMPGTARMLYAQGGYGAFFKGWAIRTSRMICAIFLIGQCKDQLGPIFYPHLLTKELCNKESNTKSV